MVKRFLCSPPNNQWVAFFMAKRSKPNCKFCNANALQSVPIFIGGTRAGYSIKCMDCYSIGPGGFHSSEDNAWDCYAHLVDKNISNTPTNCDGPPIEFRGGLKFVQIACSDDLVYGLDSNGIVWALIDDENEYYHQYWTPCLPIYMAPDLDRLKLETIEPNKHYKRQPCDE